MKNRTVINDRLLFESDFFKKILKEDFNISVRIIRVNRVNRRQIYLYLKDN
jgi:hypothetical protein